MGQAGSMDTSTATERGLDEVGSFFAPTSRLAEPLSPAPDGRLRLGAVAATVLSETILGICRQHRRRCLVGVQRGRQAAERREAGFDHEIGQVVDEAALNLTFLLAPETRRVE
jgi:hypothetical protein